MKPRAGWILLALALLAAWSWWRSGPQPQPQGPAPTAIPQPSPPGTTRGDLLPREAEHTLRLIRFGGPFPHRQDGGVFGNRERLLPARERGWYREYTVAAPGARDRGARRIVAGGRPPSEFFYTDDHYRSFRRIDADTGRLR